MLLHVHVYTYLFSFKNFNIGLFFRQTKVSLADTNDIHCNNKFMVCLYNYRVSDETCFWNSFVPRLNNQTSKQSLT